MADFSKAQIGVNPSQPQAVQAVAPPPSGMEAALGLFSAIAPTGQQINDRRERKAADATSKVLGGFTQDSLRIADAVDTGEMTSRAGRMQMRRLYSSYAANNPLLLDDLAETHKSLVTTSGLGKVIADGTDEEKRKKTKYDSAYARGWLTDGMSEAEQDSMVSNMTAFDANLEVLASEQAKMAFANAEISNQRGLLGLQKDKLQLQTAGVTLQNARSVAAREESARVTRGAVAGAMTNFGPVVERQVNTIIARASKPNRTPEDIKKDQLDLEAIWSSSVGGVLAMVGPDITASDIGVITKPLEQFMAHARMVASGEADVASMETATAAMIQRQVFAATGDPKILAAMVSREVVGDQSMAATGLNMAAVLAYDGVIRGDFAPVFSNKNDLDASKDYFKLSTDAVARGLEPDSSPELLVEAKTNINGMLATVASRQGNDRKPAEFEQLANYFASAQFGQLVEQSPEGVIGGENIGAANRVFEDFYYAEAIPVIKERWQQAQVKVRANPGVSGPSAFATPTRNSPVSGVITAVYDSGGVRFKSSLNEGDALREVANLNKELAPVINKLIKMGSHLQGDRNYRKFFDENYRGIFESEGLEGGDAEPGA
jgi:hypothetical protein